MIEKTILDYLSARLNVPVVMEIPEKPADSFVRIEKTGGYREDYINHATFALQSYAPTLYQTAELNERVKAAMDDMPYHEDVSRSQLNSDYNFTDTARKRHRYQAVYDITY